MDEWIVLPLADPGSGDIWLHPGRIVAMCDLGEEGTIVFYDNDLTWTVSERAEFIARRILATQLQE